jgi:hypothetical protein
MIALAYFATAAALLALAHRFVAPLTRGAALVLLLLPLLFTGRALLTGRIYAPVEMPWTSQPLADHRGEFHVPPVHNPLLSDIAFQMIPWRQALRESVTAGQWPLWNRYIYCGDVLAATMQPAAFSPFTWIALLFPAAVSFTFTAAIAFFVAGLSAYALVAELRCVEVAQPYPATARLHDSATPLLAAIAWMYSAGIALTILWPLGFSWALFPLLLLGTRRVVHQRSIGVLTVALSLEVVAGHPETLLHAVALACAYGAYLMVAEWRGLAVSQPQLATARPRNTATALLAALAAGVLAVLLTAIQLLPFLDAVRHSGEYVVRSQLYAGNPLRIEPGSVRAAVLGNLFPFLRGKVESFPLERGEAGSIVFALAIVAITTVRRRREVQFFAALAVFAFLVGCNVSPFAQILHALPMFGSALNDRLLMAMALALAVLAAFAVDLWPRRTMVSAMIAWALAVAVAGFAGGHAIHTTRFVAELVPLLLAATVICLCRKAIAMPLLIALVLIQRTMSDGALVPIHPGEIAYPRLKLLEPLEAVREPFRIAPFGGTLTQNTAAMYGLEDVRASTAMTNRRLSETFPLWCIRPGRGFPEVNDLTKPMLSMMNARFSLLDVSTPIPAGWADRGYDVYTRLIENAHVLPRAFVPARVVLGRTAGEELAEMANERDFGQRAWIDVGEAKQERDNGAGMATTTRRGNELTIVASMQRPGFVVVSETAWPGWRAWVDGRRVKLAGANHAFLAVYVSEGEHRVRLRYLPRSFVAGRAISIATLLLVALVTAARRFWP